MMLQQNISTMSNKDEKDLFICECQSPEHIISVYYDGNKNHPLVYITPPKNPQIFSLWDERWSYIKKTFLS